MSSKRSLSPEDSPESDSKRPRVDTQEADTPREVSAGLDVDGLDDGFTATESLAPTHHSHARCGIQRSIALVLKHDGFASATPQAMESFTGLVESCPLSSTLLMLSLLLTLDRPRIHHRRDQAIRPLRPTRAPHSLGL